MPSTTLVLLVRHSAGKFARTHHTYDVSIACNELNLSLSSKNFTILLWIRRSNTLTIRLVEAHWTIVLSRMFVTFLEHRDNVYPSPITWEFPRVHTCIEKIKEGLGDPRGTFSEVPTKYFVWSRGLAPHPPPSSYSNLSKQPVLSRVNTEQKYALNASAFSVSDVNILPPWYKSGNSEQWPLVFFSHL